jgi:hypothetical protein
MNRRVPLFVLVALALLAAPAVVAAAEPALTATVIPGQEIDLAGSGFPADADVLLVIERNGADAGSQALRTDSAGSFTATIDAGPGRGGVYTMIATSGSAKAVVEALAVETAGGAGGLQSSPPPTDATSRLPAGPDTGGWATGLGAALVSVLLTLRYLDKPRDRALVADH